MNLKKCLSCGCVFGYDKMEKKTSCPQCDNCVPKTMTYIQIEKVFIDSSDTLVAISESMEIYKKDYNEKGNIWEKHE